MPFINRIGSGATRKFGFGAGMAPGAPTSVVGTAGNTQVSVAFTASTVGTGTPSSTDVVYSATSKRWEGTVTAGATAGQLAVSLVIAGLTATDAQKAAFGAPNNTYFGIIQVAAAKTVAQLTAEITALQTQLLATTTKAKYNKLAKRWNKKNPNNKVALLK